MQVFKTIEDLQKIDRTKTLCLVPTMGALHDGHLSLVSIAKENAEQVCVSIYVNPLQFGPNEDFNKYPRELESDLEKLKSLDVDYVFAPTELKILEEEKVQANPEHADCLCGISRPGHFDGVCTVVKKLFDLIKPNSAVFGEKDYQQLLIIKDMVEKLGLNIEIISAPIFRGINGLALSSRNKYLKGDEIVLTYSIYKTLAGIRAGEISLDEAVVILEGFGVKVEYLEERWRRVLFAGRVGSTRLIDNIELV